MTLRTLLLRNLRFHWRAHFGVVLGAAVGSAALIGALVVGDSVRGSLQERAEQRLGATRFAMMGGDRLFRAALANDFQTSYLGAGYSGGDFIPVLQFTATMSRSDGSTRANRVMLHGVDERWQRLGGAARLTGATNGVWLNEALAAHLKVTVGDAVLVRLPKPTALSAEAAIAHRDDVSVALRISVAGIVSGAELGNFSLVAGAGANFNAFLPLAELQRAAAIPGKANLLLVTDWQVKMRSAASAGGPAFHGPLPIEMLNCPQELARVFTLEDLQLNLRTNSSRELELVTPRIFLDAAVARTAVAIDTNARPLLTYLANQLRRGTNATPYSMITAAGAPWTSPGLRDDEIVINQWLADDLRAHVGDEIAVSYFLPESGARLEERTNVFKVHSVVPLELPWADRTLMPDFPGLEKAESTSEWDAGFPLTYPIRKKDDDYWRQNRGTPKAFVSLTAGQTLWSNRFGALTAVRFASPNATNLASRLTAIVNPLEMGMRFEPVREQARLGVVQAQDFGQLFLAFSFFLIVAALVLVAMLVQLGLEQRATEIGTLYALGFGARQVRKLLLVEGVMLAAFGGTIGLVGGIVFARALLHGLGTIWRDAVGAASLGFHLTAISLMIGLVASVAITAVTIWLSLRRFVKLSPRELLSGETQPPERSSSAWKMKVLGSFAALSAVGLVSLAMGRGDAGNAGVFFGAGALVLIAGLAFLSAWLTGQSIATRSSDSFNWMTLAWRGCARRRKRSLATVIMLACGSFLILSIGVFRLDAQRGAGEKTAGTGGFALIGETTLPIVHDLNSVAGRDFFALNDAVMAGVRVVPLRVRAGDEASCLNLTRAQQPRLLGVKADSLAGRFTFTSLADPNFKAAPWRLLTDFYPAYDRPLASNEIAAIGDANSLQWALHKKLGDTLDYVDERGQPFKVRIVGGVANSILQGQLLIDEAEFVRRFPGESGYRMFLMDAPSNRVATVTAELSRAMQDVGLELTSTASRLNQFNAVQNTYLGTFQVLGGLGLLLGSVGLGVVVLRNVLERRSELAVWLAVGFRRAQVQWIVLIENAALLVLGLGLGASAAAVAVLPSLWTPSNPVPVASLLVTIGAVWLNGAAWTWLATRYAVRGDLLRALRND